MVVLREHILRPIVRTSRIDFFFFLDYIDQEFLL